MKKVYVAMSTDLLHHGHISFLQKASELGDVTVGVLSDRAVSSYKGMPRLNLEQRLALISGIKYVSRTIVQSTLDYEENLLAIKPDYVAHGDDWREGIQSHIRARVIEILKQWGGTLVEFPYHSDANTAQLTHEVAMLGGLPEMRRPKLIQLLKQKPIVRMMEAHNGITGLIVENAAYKSRTAVETFDGMWISSLCDSTSKGKPDIELVDLTSRMTTISEIMEVTTKPVILDGDTGGLTEHFKYNVQTLERLGVSAIIIEDKMGLKKNSLFGTDVEQFQDSTENFCSKIHAGKSALKTREFMIIARIESLILGKGLDDAVKRAKAYVEAGASGIMIHSRSKTADEVFEFTDRFGAFGSDIPVVVVPTTFNHITEQEFSRHGVRIVIYANHLIRSAFPAMMRTAQIILEHHRSHEANEQCMPISDILTLIPGGK